MSAEENDRLVEIRDLLIQQGEAIAKMDRGLYGDPVNKVKGHMQELNELKEKVDKIEEFKKKATWTFAGISLVFPVIIAEIRRYLNL